MQAPSRVYGKVNWEKEGVSFAMLPASSLEKFLSMVFFCVVVTPLLLFFGGFLVDTLLSLLPFGHYDESIHLYSLNEIHDMLCDEEGIFQMDPNSDTYFSVGVFRTIVYFLVILLISLFMLGNMIFKRRSAGKTFGCLMGASYSILMFIAMLFESENPFIEDWLQNSLTFTGFQVFVLVTLILLTGFALFFTYRKIKTQKY